VTWSKAWIEMIHRYLAMGVGMLIIVALLAAWRHRRVLPHSPAWAVLTLVWVIVQGLFGKYTVTLKLYPAIVTLHLLGAMVLLGLLAIQTESFRARQALTARLGQGTMTLALCAAAALLTQIALGGWVSTNYAVLACQGFPTCNGQWWPPMDADGFTLMRALGRDGHGAAAGLLPFDALVAIHLAHRAFALVAVGLLLALALALRRSEDWRHWGHAIGGLVLLQIATGLFNVLLQWPMAAALSHTAGAAGLVLVLTRLIARQMLSGRA
jgi:cytochrome c oxidase assembly protein subunit 15